MQVLENDHGGYIRPHPVAIGPTYVAKVLFSDRIMKKTCRQIQTLIK
jgi:hypothetical protein